MTPRQATLLAAACVAASLALAPVSAQDASSAPADYNIGKDACIFEGTPDLLLDVARSNEDFSTLMAAIDSVPELAPAFGSKAEKLTILAPTNDAFETFFADFNSTAEDFLKDDRLVKLILSYHVVPSVVPHSDMEMALKPLFMSQVGVTTSVPGDDLALTRVKPEGKEEDVIRAAGYASAAYLAPNTVWACNGVINPINYVLVPREATITQPELRIGAGTASQAKDQGGDAEEEPAEEGEAKEGGGRRLLAWF